MKPTGLFQESPCPKIINVITSAKSPLPDRVMFPGSWDKNMDIGGGGALFSLLVRLQNEPLGPPGVLAPGRERLSVPFCFGFRKILPNLVFLRSRPHRPFFPTKRNSLQCLLEHQVTSLNLSAGEGCKASQEAPEDACPKPIPCWL